jgi:DNA-directed RNA polymerase specialized sigma24 family protein
MVLLLAEVEEKKQEEIAGIMGIPIGTVKSNLHRAKEIIKKEVKKNGGL